MLKELPGYGTDVEGIYYTSSKHLVRQLDFHFSTGEEGSLYIVSWFGTAMTTSIIVYMSIAIFIRTPAGKKALAEKQARQ